MSTEGKNTNANAIKQCVQCLTKYKESENGDQSCKFHVRGSWSNKWQCCNRRTNEPGCETNQHRSQHHSQYRYGEYLKLVSSILNYTNTKTEWAAIECQDLEKNVKLNASMGLVTNRAPHYKHHLYITLNSYWNFVPFSVDYIQKFTNNNSTYTDRAIIKEFTDNNTKGVIKAEWALNKNKICGVYLSIKTQTSADIECVLVKFAIENGKTFTLSGTEQISKGGFTEYRPSQLYHELIDSKSVGITKVEGAEFEQNYDAAQVRKQKKNVKTKCYGPLVNDLMMTQKTFVCNDRFSFDGDHLFLEIQFMNKSADKDFVFIEISGIYQLLGDRNWSDLNNNDSKLTLTKYKKENSRYLSEMESMPFNIGKGRGNAELVKLEIFVPFAFEQQPRPSRSWFQRSFLARHRPICFKLKFKDIDGQSLLFETKFITDLYGYSDNEKTVFSMPIQDAITFEYHKCCIELEKVERRSSTALEETKSDKNDAEPGTDERWNNFEKIMIRGNSSYLSFDISDLRAMVYKAMKSNRSICAFDTKNLSNDRAKYKVFGYIDSECQRLYGIKMILTTKSCQKTGFYVLPMYGNISKNEMKSPKMIGRNEEEKYFSEKENELKAFAIDESVNKYYEIKGTVLLQKCTQREIEVMDFDGQSEDVKEEGTDDIAGLKRKIAAQTKIIDDLQRQLKGDVATNSGNGDGVAEWANNLGDKFEEIAKLFKAFPGK